LKITQDSQRKLETLDDYIDKNEDQVMEMDEDGSEESLEELDDNIRHLDRVIKKLDLYANKYDDIINDKNVSTLFQ